jgi:NADPH-dependent 2,4-dienoyl-CoA reductase/sulfur reductase-like enzyme
MTERLVVIGGDAAGMTAASQARRRRGPDDLSIVAFERGHHTSYAACGIPYFVGDVVHEAEQLVARRPDVFRHKFSIDVRLRHEVTDIDLDRRIVRPGTSRAMASRRSDRSARRGHRRNPDPSQAAGR